MEDVVVTVCWFLDVDKIRHRITEGLITRWVFRAAAWWARVSVKRDKSSYIEITAEIADGSGRSEKLLVKNASSSFNQVADWLLRYLDKETRRARVDEEHSRMPTSWDPPKEEEKPVPQEA